MYTEVIVHKDITKEKLIQICNLKKQHWQYSIESQIKWINCHFTNDDFHFLFYQDSVLIAYITLNEIECSCDGNKKAFWGVGNVCVDKNYQNKGIGSKSMRIINKYLIDNNKSGILLCSIKNKQFYINVGWTNVEYKNAKVENKEFNNYIMVFNEIEHNYSDIIVNKNF